MSSQAAGPLTRLKNRADFLKAAQGSKGVAPGLVLQMRIRAPANVGESDPRCALAAKSEDEATRIGFTVTRKVGNAVARNRAKRRLREASRLVLPQLARPGCDYVLIGRAGTLSRDWTALLDDLRGAVARAHRQADGLNTRDTSGASEAAAPKSSRRRRRSPASSRKSLRVGADG